MMIADSTSFSAALFLSHSGDITSSCTVRVNDMAKPYKELRDEMSPQARAAAEKKTQQMELVLDITEKLFGEATLHLKKPQIAELAKLDIQQLLLIAQIKRFPIPKSLRSKIISSLGSDNLVVRMEKRWRIASIIVSAEREGLYDAAEHATGEVVRDLLEDTALQNRYVEIALDRYPIEVKKKGKLWIASCPGLDFYSQGATKDKARENLNEAIRLFIESCSSRGTLAEAVKNTDPLNLCVSCHLAEKLKDPTFKKAYEREKAIIDKKIQTSKGVEFSIGPIQFSAEGAKALVELMENPPKPSPALSKAMGKGNKSGSSIEKEKLRKQMEKASRDFLFMKDLDESMKVFKAADTKTASKKAKKKQTRGQ